MKTYNHPNSNNFTTEQKKAYELAEKRVKSLKGFYRHLFWYLVVNAFILISSAVVNKPHYNIWEFNTYSTAVFWGIGLGVHALSVFGKNLIFSKSWEERKIQEFIEKERKNNRT
ncbi:2TM domain-containing protein [Wenyingzhuangia sp. IMCC45467]